MATKVEESPPTRKGRPPRKGSLESYRDASGNRHWRGRIRLADGSRERILVPDDITTKERARDYVTARQAAEVETGTFLAAKRAKIAKRAGAPLPASETCDEWFERFNAWQIEQGKTSGRDARYAWNNAEEKTKPPKTRNGIRSVPLAPALAPLLARMRGNAKPSDLVVRLLASLNEDHLAKITRQHLGVAKVTRTDLFPLATSRTHVPVNFRPWRDSGITWLAMMGLGIDKILRRAGHDSIQTTMGYVKLAEDLGGELGEPFARLPTDLIDGRNGTPASKPSGWPNPSAHRRGLAHFGVTSRPHSSEARPQKCRESARSDRVPSVQVLFLRTTLVSRGSCAAPRALERPTPRVWAHAGNS